MGELGKNVHGISGGESDNSSVDQTSLYIILPGSNGRMEIIWVKRSELEDLIEDVSNQVGITLRENSDGVNVDKVIDFLLQGYSEAPSSFGE